MSNTAPLYLKTSDILQRYQFSRSTLWRWQNREENPFPQPAIGQTGRGCLNRYALSDVEAWEQREKDSNYE